ncbi:MAG: CDP-alcohol phosphatidyltransferase family protein [Chloroflexi bacterium]|nr:CDP-alcohol phosphatidyltransferase family protein [Chloroflexota bacterium]
MLDAWARRVSAKLVLGIAMVLGKLGLQANTVTVLGCCLQIGVGVLLAFGHQRLGGALLAVGAGCDAVDGTLARHMGGATKFGAFLDSVLDRIAEAALFLGLGWWYMANGNHTAAIMAFVAAVGSMLVSYARARAEAIGVECKVGFFTRVERMILMVVVLVAGWTPVGLWIMAIGTLATSLHRIIHVYIQTRREELAAIREARPALEGHKGS